MYRSMVDIQSATAEIRRGKEEEIKNIMVYHIPQGFQKKQDENIMLRRAAIKYTTANYGIYHTAFFSVDSPLSTCPAPLRGMPTK